MREKRKPGEMVLLRALPRGFLTDLPPEDQRAIKAMVGRPVLLRGYDEDGRAELQFPDAFEIQETDYSHTHTIWIGVEYIDAVRS